MGNIHQQGSSLPSAKRKHIAEAVRFAAVGVGSTMLYFAFLGGLLWGGLRIELAAAIAYAMSMVFNYLMQRSFTFNSQGGHLSAVWKYMAVQLTGMGINSAMLNILVTRLEYPVVIALGVALVVVTCWTYFGMKLWVFRGPRQGGSQ